MAKANGNAASATAEAVPDKRAKFAANVKVDVDLKPKLKRGVVFPRNRHPDGGFILTKDDAIACGWTKLPETWESHLTSDGDMLPCLILKSMRVCVIASTPNYAEGRKEGEYLGVIDWENYVHDRDLTKVCQNYLLMVVDENYQPLHQRALHYKAHGNAGLSFTQAFVGSNERRGFYQEMDSALRDFWDKEGILYQEGDVYKTHFNSAERVAEAYHNCSVINLELYAEKRGNKDNVKEQAFCCLVKDWEHATVDNFDLFWRDELKPVIREMLAEAEGWSRKQLKNPHVMQITPYVDAGDDGYSGRGGLKSAMPDDQPPY